jgi:hypothetical protein
VRKIESKAAVDDAESDDDASKPDMSVRPESTALVLLEQTMMHVPKNRLEEYQDEKHNPDDWVSLIELLEVRTGSIPGFLPRRHTIWICVAR